MEDGMMMEEPQRDDSVEVEKRYVEPIVEIKSIEKPKVVARVEEKDVGYIAGNTEEAARNEFAEAARLDAERVRELGKEEMVVEKEELNNVEGVADLQVQDKLNNVEGVADLQVQDNSLDNSGEAIMVRGMIGEQVQDTSLIGEGVMGGEVIEEGTNLRQLFDNNIVGDRETTVAPGLSY